MVRSRHSRPQILQGLLVASALVLASCASSPPAFVDETRAAYDRLESKAGVSQRASVELYEAEQAVMRLESAARSGAERVELEHLANLAKGRLEIVEVAAEHQALRERVEALAQQRDEMRLRARTTEARQAEMVARARAAEAEAARQNAEQAREAAEARAAEAEAARKDAEEARAETQQVMARAEQLQEELREVEAKRTAEGLQLTMRGVLFGFDSADLEPGAKETIAKVAEFLNEYPDRQIAIVGHTDSVGPDHYNAQLSTRRAESVARELRSRGVGAKRITVSGEGESAPVAPNDTDAGRQRNRRVEVTLEDRVGDDAG